MIKCRGSHIIKIAQMNLRSELCRILHLISTVADDNELYFWTLVFMSTTHAKSIRSNAVLITVTVIHFT